LLSIMSLQIIKAQNTSDVGRIVLNSVVIDAENTIPTEAKSFLETKLARICTDNGVGGFAINPQFVLATKINVLSKDVNAGPPQMIAINLEITFFIGDAISNKLFRNEIISTKGVGVNVNKAMIDAIKNVNTKSQLIVSLVEKAKQNIAEYYNSQCDLIISKSKTLSEKQEFDAAINALMQVPDVCKSCYDKCMNTVQPIYKSKINRFATIQLNKAKICWNANPNSKGATEVAALLENIEPLSTSFKEAYNLTETIRKKLETDEKREWDFKMKQYNDGLKLEQQIIESSKAVALAYAKNQPKTIDYNHIYW